jgi:hypothetical protein
MNMLNIGMDMSEVLLPQIEMNTRYIPGGSDNSQINSSSIYSYLNIRGVGRSSTGTNVGLKRYFNAIPYLGYWDCYKNYYANKQEERGFVIHAQDQDTGFKQKSCIVSVSNGEGTVNSSNIFASADSVDTDPSGGGETEVRARFEFEYEGAGSPFGSPDLSEVFIEQTAGGSTYTLKLLVLFTNVNEIGFNEDGLYEVEVSGYTGTIGVADWLSTPNSVSNTDLTQSGEPQLKEFPLDNIDNMRMDILEAVRDTTAFEITNSSESPYGLGLGWTGTGEDKKYYKTSSQEGLGIKTYQSDLFNNWISTEWIDGTNGVNEVSAVSTAGNEFTIDALNLANKVYNMLNRIAISGGSYDDWLDAVYTHERSKSVENPIYHGSLIKELAFEEVVSTTDVLDVENGQDQPMGTLAGRGRLTGKDKGGRVKIKVSEPSYILGIVSITPRIDYSQGNKWDVNLKTMNDFMKPELSSIGFQDLITDQMAWFDTVCDNSGNVTYGTAGKQPAWINYMTNVNQTRGNFAVKVGDEGGAGEMFMTLNRRYEQGTGGIEDLTTYVDPSKYNFIFAQSNLDSQNFWVQISNKITARRKMSAKVIPNL